MCGMHTSQWTVLPFCVTGSMYLGLEHILIWFESDLRVSGNRRQWVCCASVAAAHELWHKSPKLESNWAVVLQPMRMWMATPPNGWKMLLLSSTFWNLFLISLRFGTDMTRLALVTTAPLNLWLHLHQLPHAQPPCPLLCVVSFSYS